MSTQPYITLLPGRVTQRREELTIAGGASNREFSSKELRTVGNYTLGRLIGKGSFGKVYLATHKLTNGSKVPSHFLYPLSCKGDMY